MSIKLLIVAAIFLITSLSPTHSAADENINWQEAIARLAGERTKAETCVSLLKRHGNDAQISRANWPTATPKRKSTK